ncbi:MAG: hypothetical protein HQK52_23140 [Oligoflexia bacterium]|nr:hypothetical protein [Oligoflexia bacterium]
MKSYAQSIRIPVMLVLLLLEVFCGNKTLYAVNFVRDKQLTDAILKNSDSDKFLDNLRFNKGAVSFGFISQGESGDARLAMWFVSPQGVSTSIMPSPFQLRQIMNSDYSLYVRMLSDLNIPDSQRVAFDNYLQTIKDLSVFKIDHLNKFNLLPLLSYGQQLNPGEMSCLTPKKDMAIWSSAYESLINKVNEIISSENSSPLMSPAEKSTRSEKLSEDQQALIKKIFLSNQIGTRQSDVLKSVLEEIAWSNDEKLINTHLLGQLKCAVHLLIIEDLLFNELRKSSAGRSPIESTILRRIFEAKPLFTLGKFMTERELLQEIRKMIPSLIKETQGNLDYNIEKKFYGAIDTLIIKGELLDMMNTQGQKNFNNDFMSKLPLIKTLLEKAFDSKLPYSERVNIFRNSLRPYNDNGFFTKDDSFVISAATEEWQRYYAKKYSSEITVEALSEYAQAQRNATHANPYVNLNALYSNVSLINYSVGNEQIQITVLTPEQLRSVFTKMKERKDIPFRHPADGCYARAHIMSDDMAEMGIRSMKIFSEVMDGSSPYQFKAKTSNDIKGEVTWRYHVAPVVAVAMPPAYPGAPNFQLRVIDPSINPLMAISPEEWYGKQVKHLPPVVAMGAAPGLARPNPYSHLQLTQIPIYYFAPRNTYWPGNMATTPEQYLSQIKHAHETMLLKETLQTATELEVNY